METRSSRYIDEKVIATPKMSRSNKNKYLYEEVNNKIAYGEIENFSHYNGIELDSTTPIKTREEYQKLKDYALLNNGTKEEVISTSSAIEEKVYDINSVLEEARKNRIVSEEIEDKRRLQNLEYNILSDLNKKYISKKEKIEEELEREGIRELIDTITSKTLLKDIEDSQTEKDLMSDLMATGVIDGEDIDLEEEIAKEILAKESSQEKDEDQNDEDKKIVNSFYTKSMDLSEYDFEIKDEIALENKEKRKILILVVLIVLVVLAIVSVFILKKIDII